MRVFAVTALCLIPIAAQAKPSRYPVPVQEFNGDRWQRVAQPAGSANDVTRHLTARKHRTHQRGPRGRHRPAPLPPGEVRPIAQIIGGRPSGCPHRFCGCALSIHIFGRIIPHLNLAANWRHSFPRASPAAGMVAARSGHVFKLLAHVGGNVWSVWDANSGRGRIRIHNRSIAGYVIVNPQRNI